MVRMNTAYAVPPTADARLDELAEILARGVLRAEERKSGCGRKTALSFPPKRGSVSPVPTDQKITR